MLVTGGARSGKSRFAEQLAVHLADRFGSPGYYVATAEAGDQEMGERIRRHQERREQAMPGFVTVEEPYEIAKVLREIGGHGHTLDNPVILVDCLTLWLSNWLLRTEYDDPQTHIQEQVSKLLEAARQVHGHVLFVTNEVGDGIVPEYALGRLYRDMAGWMNQRFAEQSEKVFLCTAGIPIELKAAQVDITRIEL